ncbi:MAG: RnfABCDGE type electron transport complex subunit D [Ruminococcus sp.]|nr:RnfABCDGE type electron transport complex subunit D [Ruminococcus sp.]
MLKKAKKERLIWLDIMITLLSLELMAYFYYGMRAVASACTCMAVSFAAEFISLRLMGKKFTADDLTCISDALIISLMLPVSIDLRIAGYTCLFAVVVTKNVFGGRRNMIFAPAAAAYVFALTSWSREVLMYPEPHTKLGLFEKPDVLVHSASHAFNITGKLRYTDLEILMGNFSGPAGSASVLLLLISALMLIFRGDISAGAFLGSLLGTGLTAYLSPVGYSRVDSLGYSVVTNMVLFASVYIIADRRIAPRRNIFAFYYGFLIAVTAYILTLTTAKENPIIAAAVLFTPAALAIRSLERKIDSELEAEKKKELEKAPADGEEAELHE